MSELSDGFIALPGGYGTLEEVVEAMTWNQLRRSHAKPIGLLDVDGFWDPLDALLDTMLDAGFVKSRGDRMVQRASTPVDALEPSADVRVRRLSTRERPLWA